MQNMPPQQPPMPPEYQANTQPGFQPPMQQSGGPSAAFVQPPQQASVNISWFTFSQLVGHPLVDMSTGEKIGEVGDIVLDEQRQRIQTFVSKVGLLHLHGPTYVPFTHATVGIDAITFRPITEAEQDTDSFKALPKVSELIGINVLSTIGELIGSVDDARFAQNDGTLLALQIKPENPGIKQRLLGGGSVSLPLAGVISFGPNLIVDANAVTNFSAS